MTSRGSIEAWDALSRCHVSVTRQLQRDVALRGGLPEARAQLYAQISADNDQKVAAVVSTALDAQEIRVLTRLSERIHQYALSLSR